MKAERIAKRDPTFASPPLETAQLEKVIPEILATVPAVDIHTHLFPASFRGLALSGIDELLTYHYLEAELFRFSPVSPEGYWTLDRTARADLIWKTLFVEQAPISEAARGVVAVLHSLGLDSSTQTLSPLRTHFRNLDPEEHLQHVLSLAGVSELVMTNDPLDEVELSYWEAGVDPGPSYKPALRLDRILNEWTEHYTRLESLGYATDREAGPRALSETRRFLADWVKRLGPLYMAVSLEDTFDFPAEDLRSRLLAEAVLPACRDAGIPMALMIGVRRQVNPALRLAGDASGRASLRAVASLCEEFPRNRFLVTVLSRENQHELCVYARKFSNLLPFGCWWFLNNPSIVQEITRERLEMLGTSFIPQHSDARILEQIIYKWRNTRRTLAPVLIDAYRLLIEDGGTVTRDAISRDVQRLFHGNFERWTLSRGS